MSMPFWSSTRQLFSYSFLLFILPCVLSQENPETSADSKESVLGSLRLINGTESSGRIEIFYEGEWGTICNDGWGKTEADVVCRSLGFGSGELLNVSAGSGKIFLAEVRCKGDEKSVVECANNKFEPHECSHGNDAGVTCDSALTSILNSNSAENCNFEYGKCGFKVLSSSSYEWQRGSGSTQSSSTGPSDDHSYGSYYGSYMYTEASSGYTGSTTNLTSSFTSKWRDYLSFWYHMYGETMGTLNVIIETKSGNKVIWTRKGQQGNYWQYACIMVKDYVNGLTFQGIRGSSYTGDMAIDDISFISGSCASYENVSCSFENGPCGYQIIRGNYSYIDWNIISGGSYRSPIYDHSTKKSTGRYLSLDNRYSYYEGMRNYFLSPPVEISEEMRVEFYYYMAGSIPGELQVSSRDMSIPLDSWNKNDWQDFGDHGRRWNYGCMDLHPDARKNMTSKRILFTGITGASSGIHLGLDDIEISKGNCQMGISFQKCTFNNPKLCDYKINCTAHREYTWRRMRGQTTSAQTGPSYDASRQSSGYYLYAEGSYGKAGDAVSVKFPVKDTKGKFLKFNYHMHGQSMGTLLLRYFSGKSIKEIWSISGNQGFSWRSYCMELNEEIDAVEFIAVRGQGFTSDIALDNVFLDTKSCPNSVNCDFENGMCNYTVVGSSSYSSFKWSRIYGNAHRNGSGYYAQVSSSFHQEGISTHLITPGINQTSNTSSLQFYYKVNTVNSKFMVQLKRSLTGDLMGSKFFKMDVDGWLMGCIDIPANEIVSANFTVISGPGYRTSIMLDDIFYNVNPCVVGIVNNECSFDEPNVCGYNVSCREATQYLWKRGRRSTQTYQTGPYMYYSNSQYFMYTESSFGSPGDITDLMFPQFVTPPGHYLSFFYHMYGRDIGTLEVNIITPLKETLKWFEKGNMGNYWNIGCVNLTVNEMTTVVFTGIRGKGPYGDIAIDNIVVRPGICYPQSIACDFQDEMLCGYKNISEYNGQNWYRIKSGSGYYLRTYYGNSRLRSPLENITESCIQISYKIIGQECRMNVFTTHNNQRKLSLSTIRSSSWDLAQFYIDQAVTHLLFETNFGYYWFTSCTYRIERITIINGTCPDLVCLKKDTTKCDDQSQCIDNSFLCDRFDDCHDKSDEANCSKSISCDFEDKYLCGYQFENGWYHYQMNNFQDPNLYLNNSAYAMLLNTGKAILTTPKMEINESCLQFYYAGNIGNQLEVRAVYEDNRNLWRWNITFNDLIKWMVGQFELPAGNVSLEFIGNALTSVILIDNVKLHSGKCGKIVCLADTLPCHSNEKCYRSKSVCNRFDDCEDGGDELNCTTSITCDVEHPYQCGYEYKPGTWSVGSGMSIVYPDLDHSLGLYSGQYFMSNFSSGNQSHHLMAPEEIMPEESCLTFYYSFFGSGEFEIYDNNMSRLIIKPNNINTWQKSQLQLSKGSHNITFTHRIHSNVTLYDLLALDSIGVSSGKCGIFECEEGWRKCPKSPICIPKSKFCDRENDCPGGEDELNCYSYPNVRLVGGRNIHQGYVQIYKEGQWKDICGYWPTRNAMVVCKELGYNGTARATFKTKHRILTTSDISLIDCNGYESQLHQCSIRKCYSYCNCYILATVDCSDTQCESTQVPCQDYNATTNNSSSTNTICIPKESVCDGEKDCPGGTDEQSCPKCQSNEFQCLNYECVPEAKRCDGIKDCTDESDEYHCFKHDGVNLSFMMSGKYVPVCEDNLKDQDIANKLCHFVGKGNASVGSSSVKTTGVKFFYSANSSKSVLPGFKPALAGCQQLNLKCGHRECGSRSPNLYDPLIQHGHKALAGEFPWQVSLYRSNYFTCGGILIDEQYILTAAHCVDSGFASSYWIYMGSILRNGGQRISISKIMAHRNFSYSHLRYDIAVLKLASPVKTTDYIRPACLPSKPWKPYTQCFATGWGRMEDYTMPIELMETKVYLLPRDVCKKHYKYSDETTLCANHKQPNQPGCYGDSGGPVVCRNEQGYWEAVGIFSYGRVQCAGHDSSPQVFADVYTFREWISRKMD